MARLLQSELFRLSRRLMPRVLVLILAGVIALLYLVFWLAIRAVTETDQREQIEDLRNGLRVGAVRDLGLGFVYLVGAILVVILSASTIGSEYGSGTIRTILPRSSSRAAFLGAKLLSLVIFVAFIVVLGFLVAFAASALITSAEGLEGGLGEQFVPHTVASLLRTMYVMLPYLAIAFAAAVTTRSGAAGIGLGLAMLIVEGPITAALAAIGGPFEWIPKLLINSNTEAVMSANLADTGSTFSEASSNVLSPWPAAGVLAVYTAASLGFAFWRFQNRDITSG